MDLPALRDGSWGDRALVRGRLSVRARLGRLRSKVWMVGQCALAAGVAWVLATFAFGHTTPFFAPIAAVVCLGTSYGQRLRRVAEMTVGVAVGIGIGDAFTHVFGRGSWQIVVVVAVSMSAAILLDAGALMSTQAAVQSIVVTTLLPIDGGLSRILDALVGGAVALVAAAVVPGAPLRRPRQQAARVAEELSRLLALGRRSAYAQDADLAQETLDRARETESLMGDLRAAASEGLDVVASSPLRGRTSREHVRSMAELVDPLDRALRTTRVMIRRIAVGARLSEAMPPDYLDLLDDLATLVHRMAEELGADKMAESVRPGLVDVGVRSSSATPPPTLSAAVVLGQLRSLVVDLLEVAGVSHEDAVGAVPPR